MRRPALPILTATALALSVTLPALSDSRGSTRTKEFEGAGESCGRPGETPEYFQARYQWYVETYGENGVFNPQKRLEQLRDAYADYRRELALRKAQAPFQQGAAFRFLGPTNGAGRMPAVEPHPTDPNIVYVGAAGGGCWKTTDGGGSWRALTDGLADLSVGAVAIAPSNPSIVYLGTGEGGYAIDFIPGVGVLRSTDGGETWQLPTSVVAPLVYRISVDPRNPSTLLAFTDNGVQRSTDGGVTWSRTSDPAWGDATDVARDPTNPDIVHGTFWILGSPESARYGRSTDGGVTWAEKGTGLPVDPKSRMALAISGDGKTLYSMIAAYNPPASANTTLGFFRSTDGGDTWVKTRLADPSNRNRMPDVLNGQGWYDNCIAVDPDNAKDVILGGVLLFASPDGGDSVSAIGLDGDFHVDQHQLVFKKYSTGSKAVWLGNDGGVFRSTDGGSSWAGRNSGLATRQYYSVSIDPTRAEIAYAGSQDNGSDRRGSDSTEFLNLPDNQGDGFETAVDADSPQIAYITAQGTSLWRSLHDGAPLSFGYVARTMSGEPYGSGGDKVKPFLSWVTLDPNNPKTVYTGTWRVWRSEDAGETWFPLASDAFTKTSSTRALAVALGNPNRILVAQSTGVLLSNDRGATFTPLTSVTYTLPNLFRNVEIDPTNPDVFYVCLGSGTGGVAGVVMKSTDAGVTFSHADSGLPPFGVEVVRVDPGDSQTVYAGTLEGLYRSTNGGTTWNRWGDGLPAAALHEVRITRDGSRMVVATHGRGIWGVTGLNPNQPPVVQIDTPPQALTVDVGASLTFSGSAADPNGDPVTLRWTFGDRMTGTGPNPPPVTYRTPGLYQVSLVAEDSKGGRGVAFTQVTVRNPNAACAGATPIALIPNATVVVRTSNAGSKDIDPTAPSTCASPTIAYPIWFSFTPPSNGTIDLDTLGSEGDTVMALYQGTCDNLGAALDCNDDASALGISGGPSQLKTQTVFAGKQYLVLVASWADPPHGYLFSIDRIRVRATFKPTASQSAGTTAVLPVILDAYGKGGARYQSDMTLLNRGTAPLAVALTYGGTTSTEPTTTVVIPAGAQLRAADALAELRREGIAIPATTQTSSQVGSLTALTSDTTSLVMASRTATLNPNAAVGGSFGLFATATAFNDAADAGNVYVYGLRQTDQDRANLAFVHARTPGAVADAQNTITLKAEIFDAQGNAAPGSPINVTLAPGQWSQLFEVLSAAGLPANSADGGYARISRVAGTGRFVSYGVVNDQKTSDGSFVPMTRSGDMKASDTLVVPIVLEASGVGGSFFTSELVLANRSAKPATVTLRYAAAPSLSGAGSGSAAVSLAAGSQKVIPSLIQFLRSQSLQIPTSGAQGGALFVSFAGPDPGDDVYAGVRTGTPNPDTTQGGAFGVFSAAVPTAALASSSATVAALRQDSSVRSNLAAVNAGASPITLSVQLRAAADGSPLGSALSRTLAGGEWYQWSGVFDQAGAGSGEAYAVITRTAGDSGWYAYGVLNDAKTSDGSVIGAVK